MTHCTDVSMGVPWPVARRAARVVCVVFALVVLAFPAVSQTNFGRLSGTVTDNSGGAIVGASLAVAGQDRGTSRILTTDSAGDYTAPSLVPGNYLVRVEFAGFGTTERRNVEVTVGGD